MFGDVPFFGSYYCSSDNKGRIIMPSDSKASNDDSFVLCYSDMANTFDVFQSNILNIRIRSLDNTIFSSSSTETEVRKAKLLRSQICGSIVKPISVSSQRRLTLGTDFFVIVILLLYMGKEILLNCLLLKIVMRLIPIILMLKRSSLHLIR